MAARTVVFGRVDEDARRVELAVPRQLSGWQVPSRGSRSTSICGHETVGEPSSRETQRVRSPGPTSDRWMGEQQCMEHDVERRVVRGAPGPIDHGRAGGADDDVEGMEVAVTDGSPCSGCGRAASIVRIMAARSVSSR